VVELRHYGTSGEGGFHLEAEVLGDGEQLI
jgi:hypothetical protein